MYVEYCVKGELFKFHFFEFTVDTIQDRLALPSPLQDADLSEASMLNAQCSMLCKT